MPFETDQILMQKIHQRDEHAFSQLVARHKDMLVDYCFQMTGKATLSHAIALEIFAEIQTNRPGRSALAEPLRWIIKLATGKIQAAERRAKRRGLFRSIVADAPLPRFEAGIAPGDGSPDWPPLMREEALRAVLAKLSLDDRQILVLREVMGVEPERVALMVGDTPEGVKGRAEHARDAFTAAVQLSEGMF
jgi:DNA-directed RNA polymerase specialized sigma24 family protein